MILFHFTFYFLIDDGGFVVSGRGDVVVVMLVGLVPLLMVGLLVVVDLVGLVPLLVLDLLVVMGDGRTSWWWGMGGCWW